jgi:hypothetical protein
VDGVVVTLPLAPLLEIVRARPADEREATVQAHIDELLGDTLA